MSSETPLAGDGPPAAALREERSFAGGVDFVRLPSPPKRARIERGSPLESRQETQDAQSASLGGEQRRPETKTPWRSISTLGGATDKRDSRPRCLDFFQALHFELEELLRAVQLSDAEVYLRLSTAARFQIASAVALPGSACFFFGSLKTDLTIPGSDLDAAIRLPADFEGDAGGGEESVQGASRTEVALRLCALAVQRLGVGFGTELVLSARVPILKYVDQKTGVAVDVSIVQRSTVLTTRFIQRKVERGLQQRASESGRRRCEASC